MAERRPGARAARVAPVRCAVYTRKSSDEGLEQAFNSLDAQREACMAYIASQKPEGWLALTSSRLPVSPRLTLPTIELPSMRHTCTRSPPALRTMSSHELGAAGVVDTSPPPERGLDARLHWEPASPAARPALSPLENSRAFPGTSCGSRSGSPLWLPPSDLAAFGPGPSDR